MPGFDPVSTGLSIGGSLLGGIADMAAQRKRNGILAGGMREQNRFNAQSSNAVNDYAGQLQQSAPDVRGYTQQFVGSLRGMPQVTGLPTASNAFKSGAAAANAGTAGYGRDLASVFARLQAPQEQRRVEGRGMQRLGVSMGDINQQAASRDFLTKLRAGQVEANPWLKLGGNLMSNAGSSGMFGGGGGSLDPYTITGAAANGGYKY